MSLFATYPSRHPSVSLEHHLVGIEEGLGFVRWWWWLWCGSTTHFRRNGSRLISTILLPNLKTRIRGNKSKVLVNQGFSRCQWIRSTKVMVNSVWYHTSPRDKDNWFRNFMSSTESWTSLILKTLYYVTSTFPDSYFWCRVTIFLPSTECNIPHRDRNKENFTYTIGYLILLVSFSEKRENRKVGQNSYNHPYYSNQSRIYSTTF